MGRAIRSVYGFFLVPLVMGMAAGVAFLLSFADNDDYLPAQDYDGDTPPDGKAL